MYEISYLFNNQYPPEISLVDRIFTYLDITLVAFCPNQINCATGLIKILHPRCFDFSKYSARLDACWLRSFIVGSVIAFIAIIFFEENQLKIYFFSKNVHDDIFCKCFCCCIFFHIMGHPSCFNDISICA